MNSNVYETPSGVVEQEFFNGEAKLQNFNASPYRHSTLTFEFLTEDGVVQKKITPTSLLQALNEYEENHVSVDANASARSTS